MKTWKRKLTVILTTIIWIVNVNQLPVKAEEQVIEPLTGNVAIAGVLICENCRSASPVKHSRKCTQMASCQASGYGILVPQADKSYKFYKFNTNGDTLAATLLTELEQAGVANYLSVLVYGTYSAEPIVAPGGTAYDGIEVTSIEYEANHSTLEANAISFQEKPEIRITGIPDQTYTGSEIKPAVVLTDGSYTLGVNDYSVSYSNNIDAGNAMVTITGIGAFYKGVLTFSFNIVKPAPQQTPAPEIATQPTATPSSTVTPSATASPIPAVSQDTSGQSVQNIVSARTEKIVLTSVKSRNPHTATVSWKRIKGVTGYQVYLSTKNSKSGFRLVAKLKNANVRSYKKKELEGGKVVYFKVRAYTKAGKEIIYGKFSKAKKVTVKE